MMPTTVVFLSLSLAMTASHGDHLLIGGAEGTVHQALPAVDAFLGIDTQVEPNIPLIALVEQWRLHVSEPAHLS